MSSMLQGMKKSDHWLYDPTRWQQLRHTCDNQHVQTRWQTGSVGQLHGGTCGWQGKRICQSTHQGGHQQGSPPPPNHPASLHLAPLRPLAGQGPLGWKQHRMSPEERKAQHTPSATHQGTAGRESILQLPQQGQRLQRHSPLLSPSTLGEGHNASQGEDEAAAAASTVFMKGPRHKH